MTYLISPNMWYKEFFDEYYLKFWALDISKERTIKEVDFIERELGLKQGDSVLDVCCGQGRHSIKLAQRGYKVTGVDISDKLLSIARKQAEELGCDCKFIKQDIREMDFVEEFDAAINMFTSFGLLESEEEDQKVLNAIARALKPHGKFLIDYLNRDRLLRNYNPRDVKEAEDGDIMISIRSFDAISGRNIDKITIITREGHRKSYELSIRFYACTELIKMLKDAGFKIQNIYGDYERSPITLNSPRLIIIAEKLS